MAAARPVGRVGYVISGKSMPRAVDRNRLRRRLREHVRAVRPALSAFDVILRVRGPVKPADVLEAAQEGARLLRQLVAKPASR